MTDSRPSYVSACQQLGSSIRLRCASYEYCSLCSICLHASKHLGTHGLLKYVSVIWHLKAQTRPLSMVKAPPLGCAPHTTNTHTSDAVLHFNRSGADVAPSITIPLAAAMAIAYWLAQSKLSKRKRWSAVALLWLLLSIVDARHRCVRWLTVLRGGQQLLLLRYS